MGDRDATSTKAGLALDPAHQLLALLREPGGEVGVLGEKRLACADAALLEPDPVQESIEDVDPRVG